MPSSLNSISWAIKIYDAWRCSLLCPYMLAQIFSSFFFSLSWPLPPFSFYYSAKLSALPFFQATIWNLIAYCFSLRRLLFKMLLLFVLLLAVPFKAFFLPSEFPLYFSISCLPATLDFHLVLWLCSVGVLLYFWRFLPYLWLWQHLIAIVGFIYYNVSWHSWGKLSCSLILLPFNC